MAERAGLFEAFHDPPGERELRDCVRKHFTLHHVLHGGAWPPVPLPPLWVLSAGRPGRALEEFGFAPLPGWEEGVQAAPAGFGLRLVVLPELPRARDTLLLRLLGAGRVVAEAERVENGLNDLGNFMRRITRDQARHESSI